MVGPCEVILESADQCMMSSVVDVAIWISQKTSLLINRQYAVSDWSVMDHHCDFQWNQFDVMHTSLHGHHVVSMTHQILFISKGAKMY